MAEYKGNILKSLTFLHMTMNAYEWKWEKKNLICKNKAYRIPDVNVTGY